jgi:hypothetical protein
MIRLTHRTWSGVNGVGGPMMPAVRIDSDFVGHVGDLCGTPAPAATIGRSPSGPVPLVSGGHDAPVADAL